MSKTKSHKITKYQTIITSKLPSHSNTHSNSIVLWINNAHSYHTVLSKFICWFSDITNNQQRVLPCMAKYSTLPSAKGEGRLYNILLSLQMLANKIQWLGPAQLLVLLNQVPDSGPSASSSMNIYYVKCVAVCVCVCVCVCACTHYWWLHPKIWLANHINNKSVLGLPSTDQGV